MNAARRKPLLVATALGLALTAGLAVAAVHGPSDAPGRPGPRGRGPVGERLLDGRRIADYLRLTDEQRETFRDAFAEQRDKVRPLHEARLDLHQDLKALVERPDATDAEIGAVVRQLRENRQQLEASRKALEAKLVPQLTSEQQARWQRLQELRDTLREVRRDRRSAVRRFARGR